MDSEVEVKVECDNYNDSFNLESGFLGNYTLITGDIVKVEECDEYREILESHNNLEGDTDNVLAIQEEPVQEKKKKKKRRQRHENSTIGRKPRHLSYRAGITARKMKEMKRKQRKPIKSEVTEPPEPEVKTEPSESPPAPKQSPKKPVKPLSTSTRPKREASLKSVALLQDIIRKYRRPKGAAPPKPQKNISKITDDEKPPTKASSSQSVKRKRKHKRRGDTGLSYIRPDNWHQMTKAGKISWIRKEQIRRGKLDLVKPSKLTKEQTEEEKSIKRFERLADRIHKMAQMTDEELKEQKDKQYMKYVAYQASLPKEVIEERRKKDYAKAKIKYANETPQERKKRQEQGKKWLKNLSGEKLQKYKDSMARGQKNWWKRMKEERPEEYAMRWGNYMKYLNMKQKERVKNEGPEKRAVRLLRDRINQAKRRVRKQLEQEGASQEEISRRLQEVIEEVKQKPTIPMSQYKPKPRKNFPRMPPPEFTSSPTAAIAFQSKRKRRCGQKQEVQNLPHSDISVREVTIPPPVLDTHVDIFLPEAVVPTEIEISNIQQDNFCRDGGPPSPASFGSPDETNNDFIDEANIFELENQEGILCVAKDEKNVEEGSSSMLIFDMDIYQPVEMSIVPLPPQPLNLREIIPTKEEEILDTNLKTEPIKCEPEIPPEELAHGKSKIGNVMCDLCGKTFKTVYYIKVHKELLHNPSGEQTECPHCDYTGKSANSLWDHFLRVHLTPSGFKPAPPKCGEGKEKYIQKRGTDTINQCDQCVKQFKQKATLDDHIRRVHEGKGFYCDICQRSGDFQSAAKLRKHKVEKHGLQDLSPPQDAVQCKYCNEMVIRGYERHVRKEHADKVEEFLNEIGFDIRTQLMLKKRDSRQKSKFLPTKCPECGIQVLNSSLNRHRKNVHGVGKIRAYPCDECGKLFKDKYHMRQHFLTVHQHAEIDLKLEAKNYLKFSYDRRSCECLICHIHIESSLSSVRLHFVKEHPETFKEIHTAMEPLLQCDHCPEKFHKMKEICAHVEGSHPGEKNRWKARIMTSSHKLSNRNVAERANKFISYTTFCRVCNVALKLASVTDHLKTQHEIDERILLCEHCPRQFKKREFWAVHMEDYHGVSLEQLIPKADDSNPIRKSRVGRVKKGKKLKANKSGVRKRRKMKEEWDSGDEDIQVDSSFIVNRRLRGRRKKQVENVEEKKKLVICIVKLSDEEIQSHVRNPICM